MTDDVMRRAVEAAADAIDTADCGFAIELTRLVDGVRTYSARIYGGPSAEFDDHSDASEWVQTFRRKAKAEAAIRAALPIIAKEWLAIVERYDDQDEADNGYAGTGAAGYALKALRARLAEMMEQG